MSLLSKIFSNGNVGQENNEVINTNRSEFSMVVEDIFTIIGRGTVVTGKIERGSIKVGDIIRINNTTKVEISGIEMFRSKLDEASEGDNVGLLLKDITKKDIKKGDILSK